MALGTRRMLAFVPIVLAITAREAVAGTWYVRGDAGGGGDGLTWATAVQQVQDALALAHPGDEIWVARGTYLPGSSASPRSSTFALPPGVALYGGFAGTESTRSQRDVAANPTILSGDLQQDDQPGFQNRGDNCYHVVTTSGTDQTAVLDGFTIRGGNADASGNDGQGGGLRVETTSLNGPTLAHLSFVDNRANDAGGAVAAFGVVGFADCLFEGNHANSGGGVYTEQPITFARCVLRSNDAGTGGAFYSDIGFTADFTNCLVTGNGATFVGGVFALYSETYLRNCTLAANHATFVGGGEVDGTSFLHVMNSIVWGNTDTTHPGLYDQNLDAGSALTNYSAVQGGSAPWNQDPRWVDPLGPDGVAGTADDDLRLSCLSPYIDAGANAYVQGGTLDLAGGPRFRDDPATPDTGQGAPPIVDLGPYEFVCGCADVQNYCTALPNSSGHAAEIGWSGSTSLFANSLVIFAIHAPPMKTGLFMYGPQQTSVHWGDGIRCIGGSLQRLGVMQTNGGGVASLLLDLTRPPFSAGAHAVHAGSTWNFQFVFRDPQGGPAGWNASDALEMHFCR